MKSFLNTKRWPFLIRWMILSNSGWCTGVEIGVVSYEQGWCANGNTALRIDMLFNGFYVSCCR